MSYQDNRIFTLNEPNAPRLNPALACEIGLNESLILLQIEFFISVSGISKDGQKWIFNSTRDIREKWFPFWSHHTINRAIQSLEKENYIITTTKYNEKNYDKTRWFSLNYQGLAGLKSIAVKGYATRSEQIETGSEQIETGSEQIETTIQETKKENIKRDDVQPEKKSSSFSESQLISLLAGLMVLIPAHHRKPSIEKAIEKGLKAHGEDYIRSAIAYTVANSNGNTVQKFKAYLGKCIDHGWAEGWEPDKAPDQSAIKNEFSKMPDAVLRMLASAGNQFAMAELKTRV